MHRTYISIRFNRFGPSTDEMDSRSSRVRKEKETLMRCLSFIEPFFTSHRGRQYRLMRCRCDVMLVLRTTNTPSKTQHNNYVPNFKFHLGFFNRQITRFKPWNRKQKQKCDEYRSRVNRKIGIDFDRAVSMRNNNDLQFPKHFCHSTPIPYSIASTRNPWWELCSGCIGHK